MLMLVGGANFPKANNFPTELFHQLRDAALTQGVLCLERGPDESDSAQRAPLRYFVLGLRVCRDAFCRLHGIGESPRLESILKAVLGGLKACPTDVRFLKRSSPDQSLVCSSVHGEIHSYLMSLYESVAETLPEDECGDYTDETQEQDEEADESRESLRVLACLSGEPDINDAMNEDVQPRRFLPPGSIYECFRQYQALGKPGGYKLCLGCAVS